MNGIRKRRIKRKNLLLPYFLLSFVSASVIVCGILLGLFAILTGGKNDFQLQKAAELAPAMSDSAQNVLASPTPEERGVWIATVSNINFPSKRGLPATELKAELNDIVETVASVGGNAIYFQARPSSDAFYKSEIFPTSSWLTEKQGDPLPSGLDPLAYLIEIAHAKNIAVHAWINPLRAAGSADAEYLESNLAKNNPARLYPEYTVAYADNRLYYNCGLPEVRQLVADGVREIVKNYDVDGIVFDDYFYPYPVSGGVFDDSEAYAMYGREYDNLGDFRRASVNALVKLCHDTVKEEDPDCRFGISPFGIWQNDDGSNGGSDTAGLSSYSAIYCDPLAWLAEGSVDYIAPQLYWSFGTSVARYDVLVKWWNDAILPYPDVDLYIAHGVYRCEEWGDSAEIASQIDFARNEKTFRGSMLYGYAAIKDNVFGLRETLLSAFEDEIYHTTVISDGDAVKITLEKDENGN